MNRLTPAQKATIQSTALKIFGEFAPGSTNFARKLLTKRLNAAAVAEYSPLGQIPKKYSEGYTKKVEKRQFKAESVQRKVLVRANYQKRMEQLRQDSEAVTK